MLVKDMISVLGGDVCTGNTKMPGTSFPLATESCRVGAKLREVKGSICQRCYARKIELLRPDVRKGYQNRLIALKKAIAGDSSKWVYAVSQRIYNRLKDGPRYHRWHDSGDIISATHLNMIVAVAEKLPDIHFWLPTKQKGDIKRRLKKVGPFPENLIVRVSSSMVDSPPLKGVGQTCGTHTKGAHHYGFECPAPTQGNKCGDCRACWSPDVPHVSYPLK